MLDRQTLWLWLAAAQQRLQDLLRGQTIIECRKDLAVDSTAYRHKMAPVIDFGRKESDQPCTSLSGSDSKVRAKSTVSVSAPRETR